MTGMNKTTVRAIKAGDRLPAIAAEVYGDPRLWRVIAEANDIDDPLRFPTAEDVGRVILVP
jgi:nucleoid-associated protein YgaU